MITQIGTVSVYVENQQESLKFWTEKIGFEIKENHTMTPSDNWIELGPNGAQSSIVIYPKSLMPNWKELKPSITFHCDNVNETVRKLRANGVKITKAPEKMAWGTYATFIDIDNNEFLLRGT